MQTENTDKNKPEVPVNEENTEFLTEPTAAELGDEALETQLRQENGELRDKYLRLYSEFDNFRRRTAKEKEELRQTAAAGLLKDLLPVVDDFERAQQSFTAASDIEAVKSGVDLIYTKMMSILSRQGLTPMAVEGEPFDVELEESITQVDAGPENTGKVVDVIEKGYFLNDKVLRYAKVVVGK